MTSGDRQRTVRSVHASDLVTRDQAVGSEGSSRSVDGSGTEELEIDGDPMVISANAQKQDDSSDELTIQILQDGGVVAEQSTTAEYGVASVSESFY